MYFQTKRPWFFWLMLSIMPVVLGIYTFIFFLEEGVRNPVRMLLTFLPGMVVLSFFTWVFSRYTVQADSMMLMFGFPGMKKRLKPAEVVAMEVVDIRWIRWGGQGIRMRGWKKIGYIVGNGPGVHLTTHKGKEYTFNCDDPAACIAAFKP